MSHAENLQKFKEHIDTSDDAIELEAQHWRGDGVYVRTMTVPAGFGFIGKTHDTNHVFVVVSGKISITDEYGENTIYHAPYVMESLKGTQRTIAALEDSILLNAHGADESLDNEEIENILTHMPIIALSTGDPLERIT